MGWRLAARQAGGAARSAARPPALLACLKRIFRREFEEKAREMRLYAARLEVLRASPISLT